MEQSKQQLLATLLYSDIFNYPLTKEQIWKYFVGNQKNVITRKLFEKTLIDLPEYVIKHEGFYALSKKNIALRQKRRIISANMLVIARSVVSYLRIIPTIRFIGVSGALSMENADETDDIDIFIITEKDTLWVTRLVCLIFLQFLGKRRKRSQTKTANTICLNMLLDESSLVIPLANRSFYTAHEIVQVLPLFDRGNTYHKFLKANNWIESFLPNASEHNNAVYVKGSISGMLKKNGFLLKKCENIARFMQQHYMKTHMTRETISHHIAAFHPHDYNTEILNSFQKQLEIFEDLFSHSYLRVLQSLAS